MITMILTSLASSMDGFACGFLIGMKRIRLSVKNLLLISVFPFFISLISMSIASFLIPYMDENVSRFLSVLLYFILAGYAFVLSRQPNDSEWIDRNHDQQVSGTEIIRVGIALSMDSIVTSMPLAFLGYAILPSAILFGLCNAAMVALGNTVSTKCPTKLTRFLENVAWLVFLCLGIRRLI